jgi:hypothetical protein
MIKRISILNLLITSSLSLGLMACNQRLQTNMKDPQTQVVSENPQLESPPPAQPTLDAEHPATEPLSEIPAKPEITPSVKDEVPKKVTTLPAQPPAKPPVVEQKIPTKKEAPAVVKAKPAVETKKVEPKKDPPSPASNFIIAAYNTMVNEGKKLGAACNFYLQGVLRSLGFKVEGFLANDFDVAAKKMFKSYRVVTFTSASELKRHLWSYRQRTGFIFQWERSGGSPGHVGIVERVGEKLYIYQASLNKYTARVELTTLDKLLAVNGNRGLQVYSEFTK